MKKLYQKMSIEEKSSYPLNIVLWKRQAIVKSKSNKKMIEVSSFQSEKVDVIFFYKPVIKDY